MQEALVQAVTKSQCLHHRQVLRNASSSSNVSVYACIYTGAAIPPRSVMATVDSSTEISVEWNTVGSPCRARNGLITSYRVRYTVQPDGVVQTDQTEGLETTLTGLTPFTNYPIEVAAVNEEGDVGVYSEPQYAVTDEDGKSDYTHSCDAATHTLSL